MATTARLITADELLEMREEECRYELVRGKLISRLWAGVRYGLASANLLFSLGMHIREGNYIPNYTFT